MNYRIEGSIIYPNKDVLNWGPFYYHSLDKAKERMPIILNDIVEWCNEKDPSYKIKAENIIETKSKRQIVFSIKAWYDDTILQDCTGFICIDEFRFEDDTKR